MEQILEQIVRQQSMRIKIVQYVGNKNYKVWIKTLIVTIKHEWREKPSLLVIKNNNKDKCLYLAC